MYVCIFDPKGEISCETGGNARRKIEIKAILKQTENARRRASLHLSHGSTPPGGIYVALCGTNQIEATKLRVHSTNERAG